MAARGTTRSGSLRPSPAQDEDDPAGGTIVAKLIVVHGGKHRVVPLGGSKVTVGRAPDNSLQIEDASSSRRHCEFELQGDRWCVRDLRSLNGTFVNDLSTSEQLLVAGDRVQVGGTSFYFVPGPGDAAAARAAPDASAYSASSPPSPAQGISDDERAEASRRLRNFGALLEISKALNGELEADRLLAMIINKSMELTGAERGFLILLQDGQPVFKVASDAGGKPIEEPQSRISSSVLESVTTTGEPVVTINAQNDLGAFVSIVALEVRSLLCVPLVIHNEIIGAIYVDSQMASREFDDESLNLLQAFSDQAAVALENARLYQEAVEAREREERVRRIFQKYVPADVVNSVLELSDGARLNSKLSATVLFSDIRSFTAISERLQPEEVVTFLNDYLQRMVQIVDEHGGIVDKFIGDAIMAVFGAPVSKPDDAYRGVCAGLQMVEELERFNRDQGEKGGIQIEVGIGLHTGDLIAGNIGSDKKMEYTVIGDTVNAACRVEALTKDLGYPLLATRECLKAAGHQRFACVAIPPVRVKGKTQMMHVHAVTGFAERQRARTRPALPQMPLEELLGDQTPFSPSMHDAPAGFAASPGELTPPAMMRPMADVTPPAGPAPVLGAPGPAPGAGGPPKLPRLPGSPSPGAAGEDASTVRVRPDELYNEEELA
jgi:adenylate cyclase